MNLPVKHATPTDYDYLRLKLGFLSGYASYWVLKVLLEIRIIRNKMDFFKLRYST